MSLTDEIERLTALRDSGALTEEEFAAAKARAFDKAAADDADRQAEREAKSRAASDRADLATDAATGLLGGFAHIAGYGAAIIVVGGAVAASIAVFDSITLTATIAVLAIIGLVWVWSMIGG